MFARAFAWVWKVALIRDAPGGEFWSPSISPSISLSINKSQRWQSEKILDPGFSLSIFQCFSLNLPRTCPELFPNFL